MADVSIGANTGVADPDSFWSCSCEAVGCDGLCQGPYMWWFGIKFVVTVGIYRDMRDYYEHIIPLQASRRHELRRVRTLIRILKNFGVDN